MLSEYFPPWQKLTQAERDLIQTHVQDQTVSAGTLLHRSTEDCAGLIIVRQGQLRAYITSEDGKQVTLYRLFERDICLFSASCMFSEIQFDITIEAQKDTQFWVIPTPIYQQLMQSSIAVAHYTNRIMASRFSEVMWLIEQIMWKRFDSRLAEFLIEESHIENTQTLSITHEKIADHLGTAREVVTRMLKYFQSENMARLSRGTIQLTDEDKLQALI